jgi:hypothetical protein
MVHFLVGLKGRSTVRKELISPDIYKIVEIKKMVEYKLQTG